MVVWLVVLLAVGGCTAEQNSTATTTNQCTSNGTTAAPTMPETKGIPITLNTTGDTTAFIRTGNAMINGKETGILTTTKGFAVYYNKADTALTASCTGPCTKEWPPLVADQGVSVASSVLLPKQLSVQHTANGNQVFYAGHALYTYARDKQGGMALGDGQGKEWYLANITMNNMTSVKNGSADNGTPVATATPTPPTMPTPPAMPTTPTNGGSTSNGNTMQEVIITPATAGNMAAFIHTGEAAINGNVLSVLTTNKGFAIYYNRDDPMLSATCTGQCAKDWPPVLASQGMTTVSSSVALPGRLAVRQTPNGAQVFYNGHALYTYTQDKQAGIATGRGQDQSWYLVGFFLS